MDRKAVFAYAEKAYKSEPEYLWARDPGSAVLRRRDNNKWYAVIMNVPKDKLGLDGIGKADIINVKCNPEMIGSLRMVKGILAGYHMNKDNWISIVLDDSADENMVYDLIDSSFTLTGPAAKNGKKHTLHTD